MALLYTVPNCAQLDMSTNALNYQDIRLPLDACVDVKGPLSLKFQEFLLFVVLKEPFKSIALAQSKKA